ncbi:MAG TPA: YARHG domain-containing protein [Patescibacteria group bacterium]|nr:YARHG domain-containing protein [Patescibacteria group bacterium]
MVDSKTESTPKPSPVPASPTPSTPAPNKGSKTLLIIILIIVFALILLGVGGFFGWRYLAAKLKKTSTPTTTTTQNSSQTLQNLEEALKYPASVVTKSEKGTGTNESIEKTMETTDSLTQVYYHYMLLASDQKWGLGSRGYSTGGGAARIRIEEKDFQAYLNFEKNNATSKVNIKLSLQLGQFTASTDYDYDLTPPTNSSQSTSSATKSGTTPTNNYVISDSNTRIISESELINLTPWLLKVARNEIYARHGRAFVHKDLQCYFAQQNWYSVNTSYSNSLLTTIENKNITTILNYEEKINSPLLRVDSGC